MSISSWACAWAMAALSCALPWPLAAASLDPRQVPAHPADAVSPVPAVVYQSPFSSLRRPGTPEVSNWRQSNEVVLQRGGWRQYAKQAQSPASSASTPDVGQGDK